MKTKVAALFILAPALWAQPYQSYTISTLAGATLPALPASALGTSLGNPAGVAIDSTGNIYVSDGVSNAIFKVSTAGSVTLFAGSGRAGYSGDGGLATSAQLDSPSGLAFDASGNLLVADSGNSVIRKVSTSGTITTFAGIGSYGYSGDGGPATAAALDYPYGVATDLTGNVYIADTYNSAVRVVSPEGTISTFAGNNSGGYSGDGGPATAASLSFPFGVAVDTSGNVYIADEANLVIRKVSGGTISTFAGDGQDGHSGDGGQATAATLSYPEGVSVDKTGNVYIADTGNSVIRKVTATGIITTVAGDGSPGFSGDGGPATAAELNYPVAVTYPANGLLCIVDTSNSRIRAVSATGAITTVAGNGSPNYNGDNLPATSALLSSPSGEVLDADGNVYISDSGNNRVRRVSATGVITTIAGTGVGGYSGDNGPATSAQLDGPTGLTLDASGNMYIADAGNCAIRKISTSGTITTIAGSGVCSYSGDGGPATSGTLRGPNGIAVDAAGDLYIADTYNGVIREVLADGTINTFAGNGVSGYSGDGGPAIAAELNSPYGVALDSGGNVYIADTENAVIRIVNTSGIISTVPATNGPLSGPFSVVVDGGGDIYIADTYGSMIDQVSAAGVLTVVAGTGSLGYAGDGGPAVNGELADPESLALGPNGIVYVADTINNAMRTLLPCIQSLSSSVDADSKAQTLNVPITIAGSCSWSASSLPSWITSASSGTVTGNLMLTFQANTTGVDRIATIAVNGLAVSVYQAFTQTTFSDVVPGDYYFDAVNLLDGKNITAGCGNNDYCPGTVVTRDDMAIFIVRTILGNGVLTYSSTPHFADVSSTYFAFPWIQKLYELGITAGCGGTPINYCPVETVTRDQMAIFIIRARYGPLTPFTWNATPYFADVPSTYYAFNWIQRMYQDNITAGCGGKPLNYCPGDEVTRSDMAIFLMRAGYNQLLPSTEPVIASITPAILTHGTSNTFTITGVNTTFQQGVTTLVFAAGSGITVNSISVTSATSMQVSLTASSVALAQPVSIYVQTEPQEAVFPNGLLIQ